MPFEQPAANKIVNFVTEQFDKPVKAFHLSKQFYCSCSDENVKKITFFIHHCN
jgi:hypothetical protein